MGKNYATPPHVRRRMRAQAGIVPANWHRDQEDRDPSTTTRREELAMPGYGTVASLSAVARQAATLDTIVGYGYFAPARLALDEAWQRTGEEAANHRPFEHPTRPQPPSDAAPLTPSPQPAVRARLLAALSALRTLPHGFARWQGRLRAGTASRPLTSAGGEPVTISTVV